MRGSTFVDFQMLAMSGLELHQRLVRDGFHIPTIMITANRDLHLHGHKNAGLCGGRVASPVTATTDFLALDILNRCGRAVPTHAHRRIPKSKVGGTSPSTGDAQGIWPHFQGFPDLHE